MDYGELRDLTPTEDGIWDSGFKDGVISGLNDTYRNQIGFDVYKCTTMQYIYFHQTSTFTYTPHELEVVDGYGTDNRFKGENTYYMDEEDQSLKLNDSNEGAEGKDLWTVQEYVEGCYYEDRFEFYRYDEETHSYVPIKYGSLPEGGREDNHEARIVEKPWFVNLNTCTDIATNPDENTFFVHEGYNFIYPVDENGNPLGGSYHYDDATKTYSYVESDPVTGAFNGEYTHDSSTFTYIHVHLKTEDEEAMKKMETTALYIEKNGEISRNTTCPNGCTLANYNDYEHQNCPYAHYFEHKYTSNWEEIEAQIKEWEKMYAAYVNEMRYFSPEYYTLHKREFVPTTSGYLDCYDYTLTEDRFMGQ